MQKIAVIISCLFLFVGCKDPVKSRAQIGENSKIEINGKMCEVFKIERDGFSPLFYIDCPTGSSVNYESSGKAKTIISVSSDKIVNESNNKSHCACE